MRDQLQRRHIGLTLSMITFSVSISACEKCGQWERALSLLKETSMEA